MEIIKFCSLHFIAIGFVFFITEKKWIRHQMSESHQDFQMNSFMIPSFSLETFSNHKMSRHPVTFYRPIATA